MKSKVTVGRLTCNWDWDDTVSEEWDITIRKGLVIEMSSLEEFPAVIQNVLQKYETLLYIRLKSDFLYYDDFERVWK